ncbi:MAG: hypothetical protein ACTSPM_06340 [Candidatus Heimdallarchaeota archaeon]
MQFKKLLTVFLLFVMIAQPISIRAIDNNQTNLTYQIDNNQSHPEMDNLWETNAVGGEEYLKSNIIPDGGFYEEDSNGGPSEFYYGGSAYSIVNSSYQDIVYGGTYSGYMAAKGTSQFSQTASDVQSIPTGTHLTESISVDFWYNPYANPDLNEDGEIFTYLRFYTGTSWVNIYYYFSRLNPLTTNSSNAGYYDMRGSLSSWFHFSRNVTEDYEEAIGPVTPNIEIRTIYIRSHSPSGATGFTEFIVDDVSVVNGTAYEYIQNGDFESGDGSYWSNNREGPSSVTITQSDYTEGTSALDLQTEAYYDTGSSYLYCERSMIVGWNYFPKSYQTIQPGDVMLNFDWKYSDTFNGGPAQYAQFYIMGQNGSYSYYYYYYLGQETDTVTSTNYTSSSYEYRYYAADGFGTRDTWQRFSLDLYELSVLEDVLEMPITNIGFRVNAGYEENSTTQLLIDDFDLTTYSTGDPSFELDYDWHPNDPVIGWNNVGNQQYTNITSDAHSGNYAANVSSYNSFGTSQVFRSMYLPIENNLYTDFWWKLDEITSHTNTYAAVDIQINDTYHLYYLLGASTNTILTNSTINAYIKVDNYNSTGTWNNLIRNIASDSFAAFGKDNLIITDIALRCYSTTAGAKVMTLFDDIYFVRDSTPPEITSVLLQNSPTYYDDAIIEVTTTDLLNEIAEVVIYYQNDTTWYPVFATPIEENIYSGLIPYSEYGTQYNYYVEVFDVVGNNITDDNSGEYYTYTILDDIDPMLSVFGPAENATLTAQVIFYIEGLDPGSGISKFSISIGTTELYNGTLITTYSLDTTLYEDGDYTLTFVIEDSAANSYQVVKVFTIDNPAPILVVLGNYFNWGTLVGAGVVALGFGIFFLVRLIKIKKAG